MRIGVLWTGEYRSWWGVKVVRNSEGSMMKLKCSHRIYKTFVDYAQLCGPELRCQVYLLSHPSELWRLITETQCWIGITFLVPSIPRKEKWLRQNEHLRNTEISPIVIQKPSHFKAPQSGVFPGFLYPVVDNQLYLRHESLESFVFFILMSLSLDF
jgi:hypothetical protein